MEATSLKTFTREWMIIAVARGEYEVRRHVCLFVFNWGMLYLAKENDPIETGGESGTEPP